MRYSKGDFCLFFLGVASASLPPGFPHFRYRSILCFAKYAFGGAPIPNTFFLSVFVVRDAHLNEFFLRINSHTRCLSTLPHLVIISFLVYYTFYRGHFANCGGLPPISLRRRLSVTKYEKAMLIIALIALVIDALTFLLK